MPRIKFRDFSGGLHVTGNADDQPRNTLRIARNIAPPTAGRVRAASGYLERYTSVLASLPLDELIRFQGIYYAGGTLAAARRFRRNDNDTDTWYDVTPPLIVNNGAAYDPTADDSNAATADGEQPAITLTGIGIDSKFCPVLAPAVDGSKEMLFLCDVRNSNAGTLFKVENAATGATSRWGILPPVLGDINSVGLADATQEETFINVDAVPPTDPIGQIAIGNWTMKSGDEDALSAAAAKSYVTNRVITSPALKVVAGKNDVVQVETAFGSALDMTAFAVTSTVSVEEDFVQFFVRVRRPKHLENVEIAFACEQTPNHFKENFFSRELTFKRVKRRQKRKLIGLGDLVKRRKIEEFLKDHEGTLKDLTYTHDMGAQEIPIAKNTWTRVTLPKSSFQESGTGADWSTIWAIRFTVHANKQGKTAVFFDRLTFNGGVGMLGDYEYTFTLANNSTGTRSNPNISEEGIIAIKRLPDVERHGVTVTLPEMRFDAQADLLEVWRTVGNGVTKFKVGEIALSTPGQVTNGSNFVDKTSDYIGLHSGLVSEYTDATASGMFTGYATLQADPVLPLDNDSPNDPAFIFQDAVGLHVGRMWWTRNQATADVFGNVQDAKGHVYYSPIGRYEAVQSFLVVNPGSTDPVQKLTVWNDRLYAHTQSGFYAIVGTNEPFVAVRVEGAPGTVRPNTVVASQHGLFWVAQDGVYRFNGSFAENISDKDLEGVFKNKEAVEDFPATMDFTEAAVSHNALWLASDTRGAGGAGSGEYPTLVLDFTTRTWRTLEGTRFLYYDAGATAAMPTGLDGQMLGAVLASTSEIHDLAPVPFSTTNTQKFNIKTPHARAGNGQKGVLRKVWVDHDRQGETIVVKADVDDSDTALTSISTGSGRVVTEYKPLLAGERFAVELEVTACNSKVEIYGIELDIYVPGEKLGESGLQ
jgi:hypothetical protein